MKNFIREMKGAGIKGVLSDIDGTLLDSMGLWYDIDVAFMKMKGNEAEVLKVQPLDQQHLYHLGIY